MDRKTKQKRKALGYDVEEDEPSTEESINQNKIPAWVSGYSALASFIIGIIGISIELSNDHLDNILLFFSLSFFSGSGIINLSCLPLCFRRR